MDTAVAISGAPHHEHLGTDTRCECSQPELPAGTPTHWASDPVDNADISKDVRLVSPEFLVSGGTVLSFWHSFNTEAEFDGGVLEITTDGGANWQDITAGGGFFLEGGYNSLVGALIASWLVGHVIRISVNESGSRQPGALSTARPSSSASASRRTCCLAYRPDGLLMTSDSTTCTNHVTGQSSKHRWLLTIPIRWRPVARRRPMSKPMIPMRIPLTPI